LPDQGVGCFLDHDRTDPHAAAGMRAAAARDAVGMAGEAVQDVDRHAEPFGDELSEAGFVTLALRHYADNEFDDPVGPHGELRLLARHAGRNIDIGAHRNAATFAALSRLAAALVEARPVAELERHIHGADVIAIVVFDTKWVPVRQFLLRH